MIANTGKFHGGYYRNAFETAGELEESGSSGRIDAEITASEHSSAPMRKCVSLNSRRQDPFGVPMHVLSPVSLPRSERKDLIRRLRLELEQTQTVMKKVELQWTNGVSGAYSSDILSCSNAANGPHVASFGKSVVTNSGMGKKAIHTNKGRGLSKGIGSQKSEFAREVSALNATNIVLMKQCATLLKRLMSHQYGWVFNEPVDVMKLNIPDYLTIIKHPMDLGTVKKKISSGLYSNPLEFLADVRLTFKNALEYNPPGHDVHFMADTLNKFFEVRWKTIEKKLPRTDFQSVLEKAEPSEDLEIIETSPSKKIKLTSLQDEFPRPVKQVMTDEEKHNLGTELESLLGEMPANIIDFLRKQSSNGTDGVEDEIEIDIDDLSDDALFTLRKLLDDYFEDKRKNQARGEPCEIELLNDSGPSSSAIHHHKGNESPDEDVDIGGNEPPVSSYPPVEIEKDSDSGSSSESEFEDAKPSTLMDVSKDPVVLDSGAQLSDKSNVGDALEMNLPHQEYYTEAVNGMDQLEQTSHQKPSSAESDSRQEEGSVPTESEVPSEKVYRAALLKNRFADTILKAREKTLSQSDKGDPEKLRREREELELQNKKEKARLQAEAKAAEDARKRAEAAAAAEARRKRELEREAARQALLKMEKTVEINENSRCLEDLEMLRSVPCDPLPSSVDETSPDQSQECLGGFKFGGNNPLEQLGLFMKEDDEEEEVEPSEALNPVKDVEEGEID